jgi:hypothetical protein
MDRDAGKSDRADETLQGDTGMIGSESDEPGPGRDTSLTDPDPAAASTDQPRGIVAMSEGDPMATRLGSHVEGAGVIGYDVAAAEEGATRATPAEARPGYAPEQPVGDAPMTTAPVAATTPTAFDRDPGLAAEPVVGQGAYPEPGDVGGATGARVAGPGAAAPAERVEDAGPSDASVFADEPTAPERSAFATEDVGSADRSAVADDPARYGAGDAAPAAAGSEADLSRAGAVGYGDQPDAAGTAGYQEAPGREAPATDTGEETDVTGRPEYAERAEGGDQALYQQEPQRGDRPGGGGSLFTDEEPERLDRPGPQEPGVQEGLYDQEADQARRQRPADGP